MPASIRRESSVGSFRYRVVVDNLEIGHRTGDFDSGKAMDRTESIPAKDIAMKDLRIATGRIEEEMKLDLTETRAGGLGESKTSPYNGTIDVETEITASPIEERGGGRAIQFGDLPHPVKYSRQSDEGIS